MSESLTHLENELKSMKDRLSPEAIDVAKKYSLAVREYCKHSLDVNEKIKLWQLSHATIFFSDNDEDNGVNASYCHEDFLQFLIEFDKFFAILQSPDANMNKIVFQKRLQIYSQIFSLVDKVPQANLLESVQALLPSLHYQCGFCFYRIGDFQQAYKHLNLNAELLSGPWNSDTAIWSKQDIDACMIYCNALTEATECLKVLKQNNDAIVNYKIVLGLYDRIKSSPDGQNLVTLDKIGGICNNIAMSYYNLFQYTETIPYFERALEAFETAYGPVVPACSTIRGNIATNKQLAEMMKQMESDGVKVNKVDLTSSGPRDPQEEKDSYFK